ncbi:SpoIIE family protein phosphatase [Modestobacter sp. VKM Ac-2979]|uniref:PP2C family protein-serine/threonine phosphatase n=1 Tax=unclassified Modestobacter TaxID=2643866 RepID=UPI0022ABB6AB|nr:MULTISPECIES: GAF domain-containing SpoIIE family protein phosphatase [unclassified Modestobacter]MCZ2812486.1 SpoIIE family protein phosphatase [Modestobacter sp. VKM Ac-2979]MCZ2841376.1 SpoIIE family protein phosphatase [Modestobacter sp. VKM Ac-2980]
MSPRFDLRSLLERVEAAPPIDAVTAVTAELAALSGATEVSFLIADFSGHALVRLGTATHAPEGSRVRGLEHAETLRLAGTVHDQVLRTQQAVVQTGDHGASVIVPVTDRGDAIGVLELVLPEPPEEQELADISAAGHALAYVIIANRRHTDLFEWGQRTTPFSLAAEIQRRLLPNAFTCEAGQFTLAGWLEPAATVGGDTFDYTLDRDSLHVSVSDAVGHEVGAALLATLLVGSLRNERRRGLSLGDQTGNANDAVTAHSAPGEFVTGQVMRVDLHTQEAQIVNAGHPFPLRLRDGRVEEVELAIDLPFGVQAGTEYRLQRFPLEPGDRVVFVTDGMQERNAASLDVAAALAATAALHPREVVHELGQAVLRATGGVLRDDASVVCLDWYGGPPRERDSRSGASDLLASG